MFRNKQKKIFCIGQNKTGTTSVKKAFEIHGFKVGNQNKAEKLIHAYAKRDFSKIVKYCRSAEAFQDVPFSLPYTYQFLDNAYPKSKFILTVRSDEHEWYQSLTKFHTKLFGKGDNLPTKSDLQNATYVYKGYMWDSRKIYFGVPEDDIYNAEILKSHYLRYNEEAQRYFKFKENLLVLNLKEANAYSKFCDFLELDAKGRDTFPWENKTTNI